MLIRLIGSACIIAGTSMMGFLLSWRYQKRLEELNDIYCMMMMLRGEINYREATFAEAFFSIGEQSKGKIRDFSVELVKSLNDGSGQPFSLIWRNLVRIYFINTALTEDDLEMMIQFGEKLGYLDKEMQLNTISLFMEQLVELRKRLQVQLPEKCKISKCLGILSGIFLTILIF